MSDRKDSQRYAAALIADNLRVMLDIEHHHGLHGYPSELVSVRLQAIESGVDAHRAIDEYLNGVDDEGQA